VGIDVVREDGDQFFGKPAPGVRGGRCGQVLGQLAAVYHGAQAA
jgi:hypothetical protein